MIRPINIKLNAAHPELPLVEATTFTGAPSSVFIRGVPKAVGIWSITAVSVAVTYPDNTTTARAAVESAEGVWVATIPGTATSGRTANGIRVMADGIDENGEAVTGYILGVADFAVASLDVTPAPEPGETSYQMLYFDEVPSTLRKGDVAKIDGVLKFYNGSAWEPFAAPVTLDNTVTPTSANGVKSSGIWSAIWGALAALPTGFTSLYDWCVAQLAGKANDNAVVHLTGDETVGGSKVFTGSDGFYDLTVSHPQGQGYIRFLALPNENRVRVEFSDPESGSSGTLYLPIMPSSIGTLVVIENVAPDWMETTTIGTVFAADQLCSFNGRAYRCILGYTFSGEEDVPSIDTTHWTPATVEDVLAALRTALAGKADVSAIPYSLVSKTISNGAVSLDDRAINAVAVSSSLASLTVNFPTATSGKVRDFGLRLSVASGITTAPELALPQGVTCENADGEAPEIGADGAATILYFTETASGVFLVKGEVVTAIS